MNTKISKYFWSEKRSAKELKLEEKTQSNKIGWRNFVFLTPIFFIWFWILAINPIQISNGSHFPMDSFGYQYFDFQSTSQYTLFTSLFLILNVLMLFPIAILLDRFSIKNVIRAGLFIWLIGIIGLLFSHHRHNLAFFFAAIVGFSAPIVVLPNLKLSFQWFKPNSVSFPISLSIGIAILGGVLMSFIGESLFHSMKGSKNSLISAGGGLWLITLCLVLIVFFFTFFIREKKSLIGTNYNNLPEYFKNMKNVIKKPRNWGVALMISLVNLPVSVLAWSIGGSLFNSYYNGLGSQGATFIIGILLLGNFFGAFFFGWLADKIGKRKIILWLSAMILVVFVFITIIAKLPVPVIYILYLIIGFFVGSQNVGYPMLTEQNKPKEAGSANTLNSIVLLALGAIIQQFYGIAHHITIEIMLILPCIMFLPIIIGIFIKETGPQSGKKSTFKLPMKFSKVKK